MNIMKAIARLLLLLIVTLGLDVDVWATPITFTPDLSGSSVTVTDTARWANLTGTLALSNTSFVLDDNTSKTLDFFTLTATGFTLGSTYNIKATLAFSTPAIESNGEGGGCFSTIFGTISGGTLTWDAESLPDSFTVDGNAIMIDFEDGCAVVLGNTVTVHAYVTNFGGGSAGNSNATVPEPLTIVLLGTGLLGVGFCGHRRTKA